MMTEKMDILNTWHYKIPPQIARNLTAVSFVEDLISPLLHILSPPAIKPVMYFFHLLKLLLSIFFRAHKPLFACLTQIVVRLKTLVTYTLSWLTFWKR